MRKVFELKQIRLVILLACWILIHQALPSQFLAWNYTNILDELRESGSRPDMEIGNDGSIHITYWHAVEDKVIYTFRDAQGFWQKEYIEVTHSNGYVNEMVLDASGTPHVVFMENSNGVAQYRYAYRIGVNNWVVEQIPGDLTDGWGQYGPNAPMVASNRLQHGADILIGSSGTPQIIFFDAWLHPGAFPSCTNASNYDLQLIHATKSGGQWLVRVFPDIPDINQSCGTSQVPYSLPHGDRFGEFPCLVERANGSLEAYATSKFNNHIVKFETQQNDTTWSMTVADSIYNHVDFTSWSWARRFFTFNGLSATVDRDNNVHMAYGSSFNYGDNFFGLTFTNTLIYRRFMEPDSVYTHSFGTAGSYTYRNYTDIVTRGVDSIYLVYADLSEFELRMWESVDAGLTWTQDTILPLLAASQSPARIYGDSIHVAFFDAANEHLLLCHRSLAGGNWDIDTVTISQNHGQSLDGKVVQVAGDTVAHLAFNDGFSGKLFYGTGAMSNNWSYNIEELTLAGANANAVSITLSSTQAPLIAYSAGSSGDVRLATKNGPSWQYEIVDSSVNATFTDLAISDLDTIHCVYYDENRNCLRYQSRHLNGTAWTSDSVDCDTLNVGQWPSLALNGEVPHIAYYDDSGLQLKYAFRDPQTRIWMIDTVYTRIPSGVGKFCSLKLNSAGLPKIAFLDEQNTAVILSEKNAAGTWEHTVVDSSQVSNIGRPTELVIDQFDKVWIAYNYNFNFDRTKLMHRDSIWREVAVSSQGQIADEFHFEIIGGDLFILGKKTELQNTGLAMLHAPRGLFVYQNEPVDLSKIIRIDNYPNPFNQSTTFKLYLDRPEVLTLIVYDLNGREVSHLVDHQKLNAGIHTFNYDANNLSPGVYPYILENENSRMVKKLIITR